MNYTWKIKNNNSNELLKLLKLTLDILLNLHDKNLSSEFLYSHLKLMSKFLLELIKKDNKYVDVLLLKFFDNFYSKYNFNATSFGKIMKKSKYNFIKFIFSKRRMIYERNKEAKILENIEIKDRRTQKSNI